MKQCSVCSEVKQADFFSVGRKICKACRVKLSMEWHDKNRDRRNAAKRERYSELCRNNPELAVALRMTDAKRVRMARLRRNLDASAFTKIFFG